MSSIFKLIMLRPLPPHVTKESSRDVAIPGVARIETLQHLSGLLNSARLPHGEIMQRANIQKEGQQERQKHEVWQLCTGSHGPRVSVVRAGKDGKLKAQDCQVLGSLVSTRAWARNRLSLSTSHLNEHLIGQRF